MNGADLFRLGKRLAKLGVKAFPPSGFRELSTSVRMVLVDVTENPDTTIGQVVERTGFPQSHVSDAVAKLREAGVLVTTVDPADKRRTLVAPSKEHLARVRRAQRVMPTIDHELRQALIEIHGPDGAEHLEAAKAALETLHQLLGQPADARTEAEPC